MSVEERHVSDDEAIYRCTDCETDYMSREQAEKCCSRAEEIPLEVTEPHVPQDLRDLEVDPWILWNFQEKRPIAPWDTGNLYFASWGQDYEYRLETDWETARDYAAKSDEDLYHLLGKTLVDDPKHYDEFGEVPRKPPTADDVHIHPTIVLPHPEESNPNPPHPPTPRITFVDLDDVVVKRDGKFMITREAWQIVQRLGGYAELSSSATGVHIWIRGRFPDWYNNKTVPAWDLEERGKIEVYTQSRMTGCTWWHIDGTPRDEVPLAETALDEVLREYAPENVRERARKGETESSNDEDHHPSGSVENEVSDWEAYMNAITAKEFARSDSTFRRYSTGGERSIAGEDGPHPIHGATKGNDRDSTNFGIESRGKRWNCWPHNSSGMGLHLVAIQEGIIECEEASRLTEMHERYAAACIAVRERVPELAEKEPPMRAVLGVAKVLNWGPEELSDFRDDQVELAQEIIRHRASLREFRDRAGV